MTRPIYLDHNASTPLRDSVLAAMMPYLTTAFGNPSSGSHRFGWEAEAAVELARELLATHASVAPEEVIFTSGATESNNLAILGTLNASDRKKLVTVTTEHRAVLDVAAAFEKQGGTVTRVGVDQQGIIDMRAFEQACTPQTGLVSIMTANNEIGVLQPLGDIIAIARSRGVPVHTDAAQAWGKVALEDADLISLSGHKIGGPKGVGALVIRKRRPKIRLQPIMFGGGQERGLRAGTLNVAGIVGLGRATELAFAEMESEALRLARLRDQMFEQLRSRIPGIQLNGHPTRRLPNNLNVSIQEALSDKMLLAMPGLACSSGSACGSASAEPSHVIRALGYGDMRAKTALRFGFGKTTRESDIKAAVSILVDGFQRIGHGAAAVERH